MKTRFFLLIALVIFAVSCEKDPFSNGPSFTDGKPGKTNGELHLPFKASFSTIPDAPVPVIVAPDSVLYVSLGGLISGNATQVGRIQAANSRYAVVLWIPTRTRLHKRFRVRSLHQMVIIIHIPGRR
jgi:hypothetical protein